jgi:lipopolysaccharide transport system ATP-binding protein
MSKTVIKVENISKQYRLGAVSTGTITHDINRWWHKVLGKEDPYLKIGETNDRTQKGSSDYVWALQNINFDVKQGEVLGIIGRNGAGKSTLLKILSRTTAPTTGKVKIRGRIASLLEVGTGFHPELTGRENIFLNGAILGMTTLEIKHKFDEIVEFAGVERYIDTPVKRYSSGMYVRLAFAVAAHLEPEILIVDEVLAVGDSEFQKKAMGKMKDVSGKDGRTVLFVSHNTTAIQNLCNRCLNLEFGTIKFLDETSKVISDFKGILSSRKEWNGIDGKEGLTILSTKIVSANGSSEIANNNDIKIEVLLEAKREFNDIVLGFNLISGFGYPVARASFNDYNNLSGLKIGCYKLSFIIPKFSIATGHYSIEFDIAIPHVKRLNSERINLSFEVLPKNELGNKFFVENSPTYNSIVKLNWFNSINKVSID